MIINLEILDYNKKCGLGKKIGLVKNGFIRNILFILGKLFGGEEIKEKIKFDIDKITLLYKNVPLLVIKNKDIKMEKKGEGMKITVDLKNMNLDELVDKLADIGFKNNDIVREVIKAANNSINEDDKIKLIQDILDIINKNNAANDMLKAAINNNALKAIEPLDLTIGDITVDK